MGMTVAPRLALRPCCASARGGTAIPKGAKRYASGYRFVGDRSTRATAFDTATPLVSRSTVLPKTSLGTTSPGGNLLPIRSSSRSTESPFMGSAHAMALPGTTFPLVEDRERWIAGGSLKVIDLQTKEVLAERIGYMVDRGQGSQEGFRSPWALAQRTACPAFEPLIPRTRSFVLSVLKPSQGS